MARFKPLEEFFAQELHGYEFLPFKFHRLKTGRVFVSNIVGEWLVLDTQTFELFASSRLTPASASYADLRARHFLLDRDSGVAVDLLTVKLRQRLQHLRSVFGLAIFVVTLRCEHACPYCQVSRQSDDHAAFDMSPAYADAALKLLFASPAREFKIEFQGGEPLLNFGLIQHIVLEAKRLAEVSGKSASFVITSNLALLTDDVLAFCAEHDILLSTSLDGPAELHNKNRPRRGNNSHQLATDGIRRIQNRLGADGVAALMTTTKASLDRVVDIIDEYRSQDLREIFLRPLSPYGFAVKTKWFKAYDQLEWLRFYREGLRYIIDLNRRGERFVELYASTILGKMLTSRPGNYVDMMNPAGIGSRVIVFNYDGDIYASDEARMLAEMGDKTFRLGNVGADSLAEVVLSDSLLDAVEGTVLESAPMCSDCAFQHYCGADPVYHHATQGDPIGHKAFSGFCDRQMGIFEELIELMEADPEAARILSSWVRQ
jgi:uncharacterized protein